MIAKLLTDHFFPVPGAADIEFVTIFPSGAETGVGREVNGGRSPNANFDIVVNLVPEAGNGNEDPVAAHPYV